MRGRANLPLSAETLGIALHNITGEWNLQNYIGHDCYIVAASAIVYNVVGRLEDDDALQASFKQYVERPATLCIPLLLATFTLSHGSKAYARDFFALRTDFWLSVYWVLLCGTLAYLLAFGSRALLVLRHDPRSRHFANLYLVASASGISACVVRIITALIPPLQGPAEYGAGLAVRVFVRRRFCLDLCGILAAKGQMVPSASGASLAGER